jgi:hypothetical protein
LITPLSALDNQPESSTAKHPLTKLQGQAAVATRQCDQSGWMIVDRRQASMEEGIDADSP